MTLIVEEPGPLSLVQDAGRPGLGHLGVSTSGTFDRNALRQVNALLGNSPDAAAIEILGGGLVVTFDAAHLIALCGAVGVPTLDGVSVPYGRAVPVLPGQRLQIHRPMIGLRTYLGVGGGIACTSELGSRSSDTLAGLGPAPLRAGDALAVGPAGRVPALDDIVPFTRSGELTLNVIVGPRDDWFTPVAIRRLLESPWQVTSAADRIGVRLQGPELERAVTTELPSEPCVRGSIQVAADGQPIVFGPDHPVTGGYPVIAVVIDSHTDPLAQVSPGQILRFRPVQA